MQTFFEKKMLVKRMPVIMAFVLMTIAAGIINSQKNGQQNEMRNEAVGEQNDGLQMEVAASSQEPAYYEKVVALTFDDGPGYKTTMQLLEGLEERDVRVTFFLLGEKIEERREVVEKMYKDGHLIGNHTYSHIQLDSVNMACAVEEIKKTNEIIEEITGEKPKYIRPPYGVWNEQIENSIDMLPILWSVDTSDWNTRDVKWIVDYVVNEVESGDIILMHDIYDTSVVAALEIVDQLKNKGFVFVTVDELVIE